VSTGFVADFVPPPQRDGAEKAVVLRAGVPAGLPGRSGWCSTKLYVWVGNSDDG